MSMFRSPVLSSLLFGLAGASALAAPTPGLNGRVDGHNYISPAGDYEIRIPVLPELGGTISDTQTVVIFQDDYNVHTSIGSFTQDATQRWELSTRGLKDYLTYFFSNFVMPDFNQMFPGAKIETAVFRPELRGGALITYTLLPGGSMFTQQAATLATGNTPPVAKRGNLLFIQNDRIYVISIELAERVLEGNQYHKTPAEEDAILRGRLEDTAASMTFLKTAPAAAAPSPSAAPTPTTPTAHAAPATPAASGK
ncbi:MAG: hypothetical protein ACHQ4G_02450 [Opitutales bacterium]